MLMLWYFSGTRLNRVLRAVRSARDDTKDFIAEVRDFASWLLGQRDDK